jgi:hypothetical protein
LKYLGPDERSQALLLLRALDNVNPLEVKPWRKSTPGIYIREFTSHKSFLNFLKSKEFNNQVLVIFDINSAALKSLNQIKKFESFENLEDYFFIIPSYSIATEDSDFFKMLSDLKDIKLLTLSRINRLENLFLYINFQIDQSKKLN